MSEPIPSAEYKVLPTLVVACPVCQKEATVPGGLGHIQVTCPHCAFEFVYRPNPMPPQDIPWTYGDYLLLL